MEMDKNFSVKKAKMFVWGFLKYRYMLFYKKHTQNMTTKE